MKKVLSITLLLSLSGSMLAMEAVSGDAEFTDTIAARRPRRKKKLTPKALAAAIAKSADASDASVPALATDADHAPARAADSDAQPAQQQADDSAANAGAATTDAAATTSTPTAESTDAAADTATAVADAGDANAGDAAAPQQDTNKYGFLNTVGSYLSSRPVAMRAAASRASVAVTATAAGVGSWKIWNRFRSK